MNPAELIERMRAERAEQTRRIEALKREILALPLVDLTALLLECLTYTDSILTEMDSITSTPSSSPTTEPAAPEMPPMTVEAAILTVLKGVNATHAQLLSRVQGIRPGTTQISSGLTRLQKIGKVFDVGTDAEGKKVYGVESLPSNPKGGRREKAR